jgi:hypothetical protein
VKRAAYLWVSLTLAFVGSAAAIAGGHAVASVVLGVGAAWIVQAASFWLLAGGLERGDRVTHVWITGIAGRFGVGILVWVLAALAGAPTKVLMIAYGMALVVFLLLEAGWLAVTTADRTVRR